MEQIETATLATIDVNRVERAAANDLRGYMESYYSLPHEQLGERLGCCSGTGTACAEWLYGFQRAGVRHLIVRFDADSQFA